MDQQSSQSPANTPPQPTNSSMFSKSSTASNQPNADIAPTPQPSTPKLSLLKKIITPLIIIIVLIVISAVTYLFYQNQSRKVIPSVRPSSTESPPSDPNATTIPDPTIGWVGHNDKILGISYKLPPSLGLQENSGQEISGETGTQYCLVYTGQLSFHVVDHAYAGGGACGGGDFNIGATSTDYEAGRMGGFGDYQGYIAQNDQYYARLTNNKTVLIPSSLTHEIKNNYDVKILTVQGRQNESSENNFPLAGTPGDGFIGALINLPHGGQYSGFNITMKITKPSDEQIFNQILSTFTFTDNNQNTYPYLDKSDWQTYTNQKYNYSFKYPKSTNKHDKLTDDFVEIFGIDFMILNIEPVNTQTSQPAVWWQSQQDNKFFGKPTNCFTQQTVTSVPSLYHPETPIMNLGVEILMLDNLIYHQDQDTFCGEPPTTRMLIIAHNQKLLKIGYSYNQESEEILSTFQFTK